MKYLQGINYSQLTLTENARINNLGRETPNSVIYQVSQTRLQTDMEKFNPAI